MRQLRLNLGYLHGAPLLLCDRPGAKAKLRATIRALERAATLPGPNDKMTVLHDPARGVATLVCLRRVRDCKLLRAIGLSMGILSCRPSLHVNSLPASGYGTTLERAAPRGDFAGVPACDVLMNAIDATKVAVADAQRDIALREWVDSKGAGGLAPPRTSPPWDWVGRRTKVENIPDALRESMAAREAYLEDVPPRCDRENWRQPFAFYVGHTYFAYGRFAESRRFLTPLYEQACTTSSLGYRTWVALITMSNLEGDSKQSRRLAEAQRDRPCSGPPETTADPDPNLEPPLRNSVLEDASKVFDAAMDATPGPDREALWRKAALLYEQALRAAPGHYDAPTAAMQSAFAYLQVRETNKAVELYRLFVREYASVAVLEWLEHGGPEPGFPQNAIPAQPHVLKERLEQLVMAYDALARIYLTYFAYGRAADVLAEMAANPRCEVRRRADAARSAMEFYMALGERVKATQMHDIAISAPLRADETQRVETEYLLASFDFRQWRPGGTMAGDQVARRKAIQSLTRFHDANRGRPVSAPYVVEAAYRIAKMEQSARDVAFRGWFETFFADWQYFDSHSGLTSKVASPWADYRDEAELVLRQDKVAAHRQSGAGIFGGSSLAWHPSPLPEP